MRVQVDGRWVEGTADEIARLLAIMKSDSAPSPIALGPSGHPPTPTPFVSEKLAFNVLTRRELGESHLNLLKLLYAANDDWTPAPDLQQALGFSTREFAGVLGSFGKRLANTDGAGSNHFFDQYWSSEHGYNLYRLPPSVRAAMRNAGLVE